MLVVLVAIDRPKTTPFSLLAIVATQVSTQLILLIDRSALCDRRLPASLELFTGVSAIVVVLCMPLRNPGLPNNGISPPFGRPSSQHSSPEDNLSLLQFMTVSWMSPLISLGLTRQLNESDVWSLAFEFQHGILHDRFRQLKGSVIRRLITANGLDLVIISSLGVLESLASMQGIHKRTT